MGVNNERKRKSARCQSGRGLPESTTELYLQLGTLRKTNSIQTRREKAAVQNFRSGKVRIYKQGRRLF